VIEPEVRERGGFSLIWLIPILTAIIGAWLIVHTLTDQGPLVTITFRTADGIEVDRLQPGLEPQRRDRLRVLGDDDDPGQAKARGLRGWGPRRGRAVIAR
jgi:paraquat-inducible protein B